MENNYKGETGQVTPIVPVPKKALRNPTETVEVLYGFGYSVEFIRMYLDMQHPEYTTVCSCGYCESKVKA